MSIKPGGWGKEDADRCFSVAHSDSRSGHGHKLKYGKFYLKLVKPYIALRVVKNWNSLPREVVESLLFKLLKNSTGQSPEQYSLRKICFEPVVGLGHLQRPLPTSIIL